MGVLCRGRWAAAVWLGLATLLGCSLPPQRADFESIDPQERTLAVARAVGSPSSGDVGHLIVLLRSDDPAERMLAARVLERRTGETLGYDHASPESERLDAISRWEQWYRDRSESEQTWIDQGHALRSGVE